MNLRRIRKAFASARNQGSAGAALLKKESIRDKLFLAASALLIAAAAALLIFSLLFPVMQIAGDSMAPGLNEGDLILLKKTHRLQTGDLIVFHWDDKSLLKRVIAGPGDWVILDETGRVYVNGNLLDEPYVAEFTRGENDVKYPFQVPDGSYFVMGDQRASSVDSRSTLVGCPGYDQIIGKVLIRIWPPK